MKGHALGEGIHHRKFCLTTRTDHEPRGPGRRLTERPVATPSPNKMYGERSRFKLPANTSAAQIRSYTGGLV